MGSAPQNRLREIRKAAGLSQQQVADKVGITKATVSRHESGEVEVPDERKVAYANLFAVSTIYIFPHLESQVAA